MTTQVNPIPMRAVPGYYSSTEGIQIAIQTNSDASDEDLQFFQQLGVEWAMVGIRSQELHSLDYYRHLVKRFGDFGLKIYRITNLGVHNVPEITLNLPGRDAKVEEFKQFIRNIGAAGIYYNTYAHMANGIWSSERVEGRGGMDARSLDITNAKGHWAGQIFEGELTHGRRYSEEELWDNYAHLMREIVPVAEEAGVRIGVHPDDPPVYDLGGIPRCMFGNFAGYQKAMEIADSPNIGVCLCVGCWLEGGEKGMGNTPVDAIKHFAGKGQLFKVHFRNVSNPMPEPWVETLIDNGYQDMHQVMRALREVKFDGCIIPDHIPAMLGGPRVGAAYSIAYMRALVQAVNNEFGGPA
ncbi:MAG: mannonate dehydratase [Caldilineaceae bacterium]|nr:mannonate dehydratase [Caldilineaceae bacterium]HRJ44594.1 mannonate dehydratase [Caldilineaceae bacterium]